MTFPSTWIRWLMRLLLAAYFAIRIAEAFHIGQICVGLTGHLILTASVCFGFLVAVSAGALGVSRHDPRRARRWHWIQELLLFGAVLYDAWKVALLYVPTGQPLDTVATWWLAVVLVMLMVQTIVAFAGQEVVVWNSGTAPVGG